MDMTQSNLLEANSVRNEMNMEEDFETTRYDLNWILMRSTQTCVARITRYLDTARHDRVKRLSSKERD
jgi:hypothetical protein